MKCTKRLLRLVVIAVFGLVVIVGGLVVFSPHLILRRPGLTVKDNMYTLRLAAKDFSRKTGGVYPASINTSVKEVLGDLGRPSDDESSISGARGLDPVSRGEVGSVGPGLLPDAFRNPYNDSSPVVATLAVDPPIWTPESAGMVFYVPVGVKGKLATGYKVYGAGREGLLDSVLTSER